MFIPIYKPYVEENKKSTYEEIVCKQFNPLEARIIIARHRRAKHGLAYDTYEGIDPKQFQV